MHRCIFAIKASSPGEQASTARNVVYKEVLEGVQPKKSSVEVQTEETREVDDITEWTDYDAIEMEMEDELDEDAISETGPDSKEEAQRRVEARRRTPPAKRGGNLTERSILSAEENIPSRLDYGPLSEYERIRDCIVEERDQLFLETFGFPLNQRHAVIGQLLGQEEGDSDDNEEEQVTKINESGCQLQNDMCHSSGVKQLVKPRD